MKQHTLLHRFQKTGETKEQSTMKTPSKPANDKRTSSVIVTPSETTQDVVDLVSDSEHEDSSPLRPLAIHNRASVSSRQEDTIQQKSKDRDSEKKVNNNKLEDEECFIVEAPTQTLAVATSNRDEDVEIVGATGPNALEDFPHPRQDCVSFPVQKNSRLFCKKCYCYVCDSLASECPNWTFHCEAKAGVYFWEQKRKTERTKRKKKERCKAATSVRKATVRKPTDDQLSNLRFPELLMKVLSNEFCSGTISWLPHGGSFEIRNEQKFESQVLPLFRKTTGTTFASFARSLQRWGFSQVLSGQQLGYYHKYFLRDEPRYLSRICMNPNIANKIQQQQQQQPVTPSLKTIPRAAATPMVAPPVTPDAIPFGAMPLGMPGMPMPGIMPMMDARMQGLNPFIYQQMQYLQQQIQRQQQLLDMNQPPPQMRQTDKTVSRTT